MPIEVFPHVEFLEATNVALKLRYLSHELTNVKIAIAYMTKKGFRLLADSLYLTSNSKFMKSGLGIKFLVGLSEEQFITDYEPLQQLINIKKKLGSSTRRLQIRYYNNKKFHPKMFILTSGKRTCLLIGSSNITEGGLKTNKEANLLVEAEIGNKTIEYAKEFFDELWKYAHKLTQKDLKTYMEDKENYEKTRQISRRIGRLPKDRLPSRRISGSEELYLFIEDIQYPLSMVRSYCTECGRPTPIPPKWLKHWKCERHGERKHILRMKAKTEIHIEYSGRKVRNVKKVEGKCLHKAQDGSICSTRFSLGSDLSHQICQRCYRRRKKEGRPCYRIPRTRILEESFFYDTHKNMILAYS